MIMATLSTAVLSSYELTRARPAALQAAQRPLLRRFLDTLAASRRRRAEREVARFVDSLGGRFTDTAEREIERRFLAAYR
jgi:hypothetical protein